MIDWEMLVQGFNESNTHDIVEFIQNQRWFGGKGRGISDVGLVDVVVLADQPPLLIALIDVRTSAGASDLYQLVLRSSNADQESETVALVTTVGETAIYEASHDPRIAEIMTLASGEGTVVSGEAGEVRFRTIRDIVSAKQIVRPLGAEQSNTSIVINEQLLLKLYRRLEAGINPDLELQLFLTEHEFDNIPQLAGWYSYGGANLRTILGLAQQFIPDAIDGWSLGLAEIPNAADQFLPRLSRLGEVIGDLHCVLASDLEDPSFAPEDPTEEAAAILGAKLEGQIDELSDAIPYGRADELRSLARSLTESPISGQLIRTHGDLHLGQVLWTGEDWLVIDFEGEPTRTLAERRRKLHPLRDIAGMFRSFSYLSAMIELEHPDALSLTWENDACESVLSSYRTSVASAAILPNDLEVQGRLLRIFQLEKILYELNYEIQNRPAWIPVPLAGIDRLLADQTK